VNGTFVNSNINTSDLTVTSAGGLVVSSTGNYVHNTTSGISTPLGNMTLQAGSTFTYRGSSILIPSISISGKTYQNLVFESSSGSWSSFSGVSGSGILTVQGNLTIGGSGQVQ